jgi:hypothetical protein
MPRSARRSEVRAEGDEAVRKGSLQFGLQPSRSASALVAPLDHLSVTEPKPASTPIFPENVEAP